MNLANTLAAVSLSLAGALVACDADDAPLVTAAEPPSCAPDLGLVCVDALIQLSYTVDKADIWYVRTQCVDGEAHYWLDTGAPAYDSVDYIFDSACDTVCSVGGFREASTCLEAYDAEAWEEVWRG